MLMRPVVMYNRKQNFPTNESSSAKIVDGSMTQFGYIQNDQSVTQNANSVVNYSDLHHSKGNYIVDADGNTMLDLTGTGELNPLGYNHDLFKSFVSSKDIDNSIINGFAADSMASANFAA